MSIPFPHLLRLLSTALLLAIATNGSEPLAGSAGGEVTITPNESAKRIDVAIAGKPFTSYRWDPAFKKPVLYPLRSAAGTIVTRGWPVEPRPGERIDHPHHIGLWFNYGDVNGIDFWGNSGDIKPDEAAQKGTIVHRAIVKAQGGADSGTLTTDMDWTDARGNVLVHERATFVFRGDGLTRSVDRIAALTAASGRVAFNDTKEGMLGLRVARQLEQPSNTPEVFTDASGKPTTVPALDNTGVTGMYTSSEGKTGDAVWGTRGRWTMLRGRIGAKPVTLAILDHRDNPGFPTRWHARGYGLFAANPIGQAGFTDGGEPKFTLTLEPGSPVAFRYRLLIIDGEAAPDSIEREFQQFSARESSQ
jgi:hypothetical protein